MRRVLTIPTPRWCRRRSEYADRRASTPPTLRTRLTLCKTALERLRVSQDRPGKRPSRDPCHPLLPTTLDSMEAPTEKSYALVIDISPSEQLSNDANEIKSLAMVLGLGTRTSCEHVGSSSSPPVVPFPLKKWSGSSRAYKRKFLDHAEDLVANRHVLFGSYIANNRGIRRIGEAILQRVIGPTPKPCSYSSSGRPRIAIGGFKVDGKRIGRYEILRDDLLVLGWYAEAILAWWEKLQEINDEFRVRLEVIVDRLPNEQGAVLVKATTLKLLCQKASSGAVVVVGVPSEPDALQRDLLADNIAGLGRDLELQKAEAPDRGRKLLRVFRRNVL